MFEEETPKEKPMAAYIRVYEVLYTVASCFDNYPSNKSVYVKAQTKRQALEIASKTLNMPIEKFHSCWELKTLN